MEAPTQCLLCFFCVWLNEWFWLCCVYVTMLCISVCDLHDWFCVYVTLLCICDSIVYICRCLSCCSASAPLKAFGAASLGECCLRWISGPGHSLRTCWLVRCIRWRSPCWPRSTGPSSPPTPTTWPLCMRSTSYQKFMRWVQVYLFIWIGQKSNGVKKAFKRGILLPNTKFIMKNV